MGFILNNSKIAIPGLLVIILCFSCSGGGSGPTADDHKEISFTSNGSAFSPVIVVTGSPTIRWTWADGTESNLAAPVKDYGSSDVRINKLHVNPWSSVVRINIGYDGGDGGSPSIEHVADQKVSSVEDLDVVAPYLQQWCSSYNQITSLDFSDFIQLDTIECYLSQTLAEVNLSNTPSLRRACFEDCDLANLDLSQSPNLEDLRSALNSYLTIDFGTTGDNLWHICIRDNFLTSDPHIFSDTSRFPNLEELFIWSDHQTGELNITSTGTTRTVLIYAHDNEYESADFTGALQDNFQQGFIDIRRNHLASITLTGCAQITSLNAQDNLLTTDSVDEILAALDVLNRNDGFVDLSGNDPPSESGRNSASALEGKGWTVYVEE